MTVVEPASEQQRILIIGAGSTGLALANGLNQAGIPCTVLERDESLTAKDRDWNMGLLWGAPVLKGLVFEQKWSKLQSVQVDPHTPTKAEDFLHFVNGKTEDIMTSIPINYFYRLRRSKLRALLADGVDVRYAKQLSDITYDDRSRHVTAHFTDGTSERGVLLVGADGARSTLRRMLLGPEKGTVRRLPYAATFIQARYTADQAVFLRKQHPLFLASPNPDDMFAFFGMHDCADPDRPESWTFFFYISWRCSLEEQEATADWSDKQRLTQAKEFAAKSFGDPWKSAYEWLPDDSPVWYMTMNAWDPGAQGCRWNNHDGRVTMAGDAAHAMTFQRGQGLNHSIADAGKLCEAIKSVIETKCETEAQAEAIAQYEDEMIARAGQEVRVSTNNTEMLHD